MFGWRMEEEAKLEFTITVNWRREDGSIDAIGHPWTAALAARPKMWVCNSRTPSEFSGDSKRLWPANNCSGTAKLCGRVPAVIVGAHLKDYRCRRFDTVFGRLGVRVPSFDGCRHCGERLIASPVSELLPERVSPELRHLQAQLAAQFPYRQAAALLEELLPETGGLNYATTRN